MTDTWVRLAKAFMAASLGVTMAKLATDRGGGQFLLTLIAYVLASTAAPYWASMKLLPRLAHRRAVALGIAVCVFGAADVALRTRGFFFPTDSLDGRLAFWLPISSVAAIPFIAVIVHTFITAVSGERRQEAGDRR